MTMSTQGWIPGGSCSVPTAAGLGFPGNFCVFSFRCFQCVEVVFLCTEHPSQGPACPWGHSLQPDALSCECVDSLAELARAPPSFPLCLYASEGWVLSEWCPGQGSGSKCPGEAGRGCPSGHPTGQGSPFLCEAALPALVPSCLLGCS